MINLRGENSGKKWFEEEKEVLKENNVNFINLKLSKSEPPPRYELIKFLNYFENIEYPILIHCKEGYNRSYFFLNLLMMLKDKNLKIKLIWKSEIWVFFKDYKKYLIKEKINHNSSILKFFIRNIWVPEKFLYEIKIENLKEKLLMEEDVFFKVYIKNKSNRTWVLKKDLKRGIRLGGKIFGPFENYPENLEDLFYKNEGSGIDLFRAGVWDGKILPGETKIFEVHFKAPNQKGKYFLSIDMVDENVEWFYYNGKAPFFYLFEVL